MTTTGPFGLGLMTLGFYIYGYGQPALASGQAGIALEDASGAMNESPHLDPDTGDYQIDSNGQVVGSSTISNAVYLAIATTLGSTPLATLGVTFYQLKTINQSTTTQVQNIVYTALASYVQSGQISIVNVIVTYPAKGSSLHITVKWVDNTTGNQVNTVINQ